MNQDSEKQDLIQRSNISLVNGMSLIVLTITAVIALWLVSPRSTMLLELIGRSSSPEIALAFLSALERNSHQQDKIDLLKIKNYLILNQLAEAESIILPMLTKINRSSSAATKDQAYSFYLDMLLAYYNGNNAKQKRRAKKLLQEFFADTKSTRDVVAAQKLARIASAFSMPDKAYQFLFPFLATGEVSDRQLLKLALQYENYPAALVHQENIFKRSQTIQSLKQWQKTARFSGEKSIKLSFFSEYEGVLKNDPEYLQIAIHSALANDDVAVAESFYRRINALEYSDQQLSNIASNAIQFGHMRLAQDSLQVFVDRSPNTENMTLLHDLLLWKSDIISALELTKKIIALKLNQSNLSENLVRQGLKEAQAVGDMPLQGKLYTMLEQHDFLMNTEMDDYIYVNEQTYGSQVTLSEINRLLRDDPKNTALLHHKLRILSYLSRHKELVDLWRENKSHMSIDNKQASKISDALLKNNQSRVALEVLTDIENWQQSDANYLEQVFALAWNIGEKNLAIEAQVALMNHETFDSSSSENVFRYIQLHQPFKFEDIEQLISLYQSWDNERMLLIALDLAAAHKDNDKLDELLELASRDERLVNHPLILYYAFVSAIKKKDEDEVDRLFSQILATTPESLSIVSTYLWWLIDSQQQNKLAVTYNKFKLLLVENLNLPLDANYSLASNDFDTLMALTAAGHRLGLLTEADALYQQVFRYPPQSANNHSYIQLILNYAQLLDLKGDSPKAYQLRQYVAQNLTDQLLALNKDNLAFLSMVAIFSGEKNVQILSEWQTVIDPSELKVTDLYSHYIANQRFESLYFWNSRGNFSKYKIPDWEQLSIALKRKDKLRIKQLLDESLELPPADENFAMQTLGLYRDAWEHGELKLARLVDKNAEKQLRFIHINQHPIQSSGYGTNYKSISKWDINRTSIFYYQPIDTDSRIGQWRLDGIEQKADTTALLQNESKNYESRIKLNYREKYASLTDKTAFRWGGTIDIADGLGKLRTGISAELGFAIDDYWQSSFKVGFSNAIESSQLSTLAARDNTLGLSLDYAPSKRERVSFSVNYHDLDTRFNDEIGQGWDASIRVSEKFFFADPAWEIYSAINLQQYSLNQKPLENVNQVLQLLDSRPIVSNDFIDKNYAHISFGQRLSHGIPMSEGAMVPSPRYWLDTAVGYNSSNRADFTVSAGFGWRILGDDELSFSVDWQSQDISGDVSLQMSLGYYYNL